MRRRLLASFFIECFVVLAFGQRVISPEEITALQGINFNQVYVPYEGYWSQSRYREYFDKVEKVADLKKDESRLVGGWLEWERTSTTNYPEFLTAMNGDCLWFLPDKTFLATYNIYPGTMKVYFLIGQWKIESQSLYVKNILMAYTSDPAICYEDKKNARGIGSNVLLHHFTDDWYLLYPNINDIDWNYGYTYEGFKPLQLPRELVGSYQDFLRPDLRRAIDFSSENIFLSFPLIFIYQSIQKILSGDEKAINDFARIERQVIPE